MRLRSTEALVLAALAVAGCGAGSGSGGRSERGAASGRAVGAAKLATPVTPAQVPAPATTAQEPALAKADPVALQTASAERHALVARARAKRAQREQLVHSALKVALRTLRTPQAKLKIAPGGSTVGIKLSQREACAMGAKAADRLPAALGKELSFVKAVELVVIGSSETPSGFIIDHCRKPKVSAVVKAPPEPPAVLAETGSYFAVTKPFSIHSKRWTLEYSTTAHYFKALLVRGSKQTEVDMAKGGIGKRSFAGPGRFQLRVSSSGKWTIRVHEGG